MSTKKIIFSIELNEYRPIIWYGEPVFKRYNQLKSILLEKLGDEFAQLLSEPVVSNEILQNHGKAHWMSDYISKGNTFSKLPEQEQEQIKAKLSSMLNKIKKFAKELQLSEEPNTKELGELLLLAIEVPDINCVVVESGKIVLVLWGFNSEKTQKGQFQLSKVLAPPVGKTFTTPPVTENNNEIVKDDKIKLEKQLDETNKIETQSTDNQSTDNNQTTNNTKEENKNETKKSKPAWLWMLIGALIMALLLALLYFLFLKDSSISTLPDKPDVVPPIDTTKVDVDPEDPVKRKILNDKVNVAIDKNINLKEYSEKLIAKYKDNLEIVYYDTVINLIQVKTPEGQWKQWLDSIKKIDGTKLVFAESLFDRKDKPSDPGFADSKKSWYFDVIKAYSAWDISKGSDKIIVAVIDNGFDLNHPEFKDKIVLPWNVPLHSKDVHPVGKQGGEHGTHVAATAIGIANNGQGVSGIAPNCKFMPIQVADKNGMMSSLYIVSGILYAIHHNADVINMSLGMMFPDEVAAMPIDEQKKLAKSLYPDEAIFWNDLYSFALEKDLIIVQAAGNSNIVTGIDPGARSKNTIIVSAIDPSIKRASFSNFGEMSTISAPGVEIYSASPNNDYKFLQGTSMASPIVAGAVALMKTKYPEYKAKQIIELLVNTAKPLSTTKKIGPLLQLDKALKGDTSSTEMIIPENPEDLTFAEGRWKSSNELISTVDSCKISLYFDIEKSGNGKLTLVEEKKDGRTCTAKLNVSFKDGKLVMEQPENAVCDKGGFYNAYLFECVQGAKNVANCKAKIKDGSGNLIDFHLRKVK